MRVFIIDPSLRVLGGHHLSQAKCLLAESSAMGIPCTILGNLSAEPRTLGLSIWRHFRISGYGAVEHDEHDQKYTAKKNQILYQDLKWLSSRLFRGGNLVLFPAVTRNQVLGICRWIARLEGKGLTSPRVAICLMFPPDWPASPSSSQTEAIYRQAVACLSPGAKVIWTCETADLAEAFEPIIGCRPIVLPVVLLPDKKYLATATREDQLLPANPVVSVLGCSRAEKGSLMVPEIVKRVVQMRPSARFTLQAQSESTRDENALAEAYQKLRPAPRIVRGSVTQDAFVQLLEKTDLLLLPYDAENYKQRGSGLANQATALGIPIVAPTGCAFADKAAQENRAVLYKANQPESIAAAVIAALDQLERLKVNATTIALNKSPDSTYLATILNAFTKEKDSNLDWKRESRGSDFAY